MSNTDKYLEAIDRIEREYSGDLSAMFEGAVEVAMNDDSLSLDEFIEVFTAYLDALNRTKKKPPTVLTHRERQKK